MRDIPCPTKKSCFALFQNVHIMSQKVPAKRREGISSPNPAAAVIRELNNSSNSSSVSSEGGNMSDLASLFECPGKIKSNSNFKP